MIKLTDEQARAAAAAGDAPLTVVHPKTNASYVLVRRGAYERLKAALEEGPDLRRVAAQLEQLVGTDDRKVPEKPLSVKSARAVLRLNLGADSRARMHALAVKNQEGALAGDEHEELMNYCRVGLLLDLLRAKARRALKRNHPRR